MKQLYCLIFIASFLSCSKKQSTIPESKVQDTIIAKVYIKSDDYRKITRYSLVIAGDSSKTCIFSNLDSEGKVNLHIGLGNSNRQANYIERKPYQQRYNEIKKLIPHVADDLDVDSLENVSIGFLIETGDLAIDVSREYYKRYGNPGRINWKQINTKQREQINKLLLTSRTNEDLNRLLTPLRKKISKVNPIEKLMFEPKKTVLKYSVVESNTTQIPEYILDGHISFKVINK